MCEWSGVNADGSRFDVTEIRKGKEVEVKPVVVVEPETGAETASETQPKAEMEAGTEISPAPATAPVTAAEVPSTGTVVDTIGTGDKPKGDPHTATTTTTTSETSSNTAADPAKLQAMRQQVIGCVLQNINFILRLSRIFLVLSLNQVFVAVI